MGKYKSGKNILEEVFAILLCAGPACSDSKELYLDGSDIGGEKRRWPSILEQCANSLA